MDVSKPISFTPTKYTQSQFRHGISKLEDLINNDDDNSDLVSAGHPLKETFLDRQYIREIFNPAGQIIVTKIHKVEHPFFLLQGEMSIITEKGEEHTDCTFVTIHPTELKDTDKIEEELIAKNYQELEEL